MEMRAMKTILFLIGACFAAVAAAQAPARAPSKDAPAKATPEAHRKQDIARHRQMARAHEEAARCLEAGEKEAVCHERLREACKGIAVGRYCGMRHEH